MTTRPSTRSFRPWYWASIFTIVSLILAACAPAPTAAPTQQPPAATQTTAPAQPAPTQPPAPTPTEAGPAFMVDQLRVAITGDEATLNPYTYVTGFPGWNLLTMQYDTLYTLNLQGEPQPWLVEAYEISPDGLSYTLTLKEGIQWFDGQPLTAEDVKFTFEYFTANRQSRFTRDVRGFSSASVDGERQVTITLAAPNPMYPLTAFADVPILPKHIWEGITTPAEHIFPEVTNIGTGPYKLVEYQADQFYRFEANTDYFAGMPAVGELVVVRFADMAGALAAFQTNEVDMIFPPVPPEQIDLLQALDGVKIAQGPQYTTQIVYFDTQRPPFDQVEVRRAIALALDTQDMVDTVYLGFATRGNIGWIHPASPVFNSQVTTEYNLEEANQLLDSVGMTDTDGDGVREYDGNPMSFEMLTPSNNPLRLRLAELAKEMLLKAGIAVQVSSVEQATWEAAVWPEFDVSKGRNYQMAMWGWSAPVQANPYRITELIHSDPAIGNSNLTGFKNEQADALSNELLAETDPARREQLVKDLQALIAEQVPFVMLMYPDGVYAYRASVYDNLAFMSGQGVVHKLSFLPETARP